MGETFPNPRLVSSPLLSTAYPRFAKGAVRDDFLVASSDAAGVGSFTKESAAFPPAMAFALSAVAGSARRTGAVVREPESDLVSNTNDSGIGSLRQAILNADNYGGANLIQFSIPSDSGSVETIFLQSATARPHRAGDHRRHNATRLHESSADCPGRLADSAGSRRRLDDQQFESPP